MGLMGRVEKYSKLKENISLVSAFLLLTTLLFDIFWDVWIEIFFLNLPLFMMAEFMLLKAKKV